MAWFDDPSKELNRLNQRLLEEEEPEEDYFDEEMEDEEIPGFPDYNKGFGPEVRSFAKGYRGEALLEEEEADWEGNEDEPYALFYETRRERRRRIRKEKKEKKKKRNNALRLKVIVLVETLVILGFLIWWVMNQWPW